MSSHMEMITKRKPCAKYFRVKDITENNTLFKFIHPHQQLTLMGSVVTNQLSQTAKFCPPQLFFKTYF